MISGYRYPKNNQSPGYHTRKLSNQAKGKVLVFVSKSLKNNIHSQLPDIFTRRLCNLRVTISGGCATVPLKGGLMCDISYFLCSDCWTSATTALRRSIRQPLGSCPLCWSWICPITNSKGALPESDLS